MKTGKLPENVLKRSVLRQIHTGSETVQNGAGIGRDCAILAFSGKEGIAASMQEGMVAAQGEAFTDPAASEPALTIGTLIQRCANNLAAGGARPSAAMVTLLLPERAQEAEVKALMAEAAEKCRELSMEILGGQTRTTKGADAVLAVVTGFGRMRGADPADAVPKSGDSKEPPFGDGSRKGAVRGKRASLPGQDVVLSKWIGLEGTALLAKGNRARLLKRYPAYLVEEAEGFGRYLSIVPEAEIAADFGIGAMHDASEGGILGALWELAEGAGVGLTIDMRKLPLRQETVEVCECCGVNPYELLAGGCLIMTAQDGPGLAAALEREGIPAALVGKVTEGNDRILINGDEIRYMDRPKRDGIYGFWESRDLLPRE